MCTHSGGRRPSCEEEDVPRLGRTALVVGLGLPRRRMRAWIEGWRRRGEVTQAGIHRVSAHTGERGGAVPRRAAETCNMASVSSARAVLQTAMRSQARGAAATRRRVSRVPGRMGGGGCGSCHGHTPRAWCVPISMARDAGRVMRNACGAGELATVAGQSEVPSQARAGGWSRRRVRGVDAAASMAGSADVRVGPKRGRGRGRGGQRRRRRRRTRRATQP